MWLSLILFAALVCVVISLMVTRFHRSEEATDLRRSNARVLKELKDISIHRPHFIVDIDGTRKEPK